MGNTGITLEMIGGRNRHNARRRKAATLRRKRLVQLLWEWYHMRPHVAGQDFRYGRQKWLALRLGVSQSTISRDMAATLGSDLKPCPTCGHMVHSGDLGYQPIRAGRGARRNPNG